MTPPNAALVRSGTPAEAEPASGNAQPMPVVPFTHSAHEHREKIFDDTWTPSESTYDIKVRDIPAYGYIRHIILKVTGTGGVLDPQDAVGADWPWNILERVALTDTNGSPIVELDGYALMLMNVLGGYGFNNDPRDVLFTGGINPTFYLRIPVEINHADGWGSISNQNSASQYQLSLRARPFNLLGDFDSAETTTEAPDLKIEAYLEAWSLPNERDALGRPQAQMPPLHGTSQYLSSKVTNISAGEQTIEFDRVGHLLKAIALIARDENGVRTDAVFPNPYSLKWDGNDIDEQVPLDIHKIGLREAICKANPAALDTGLMAFTYNRLQLNKLGDSPPGMYLPSVNSSRIEVKGVCGAPGTIQVITNDVAPVEVAPADRYEAPNRTNQVQR